MGQVLGRGGLSGSLRLSSSIMYECFFFFIIGGGFCFYCVKHFL